MMAAEEHEPGRFVAKPVIIRSDGGYIMCVLAAPDKVVYDKLRDYLGTQDVALADEDEFRNLFSDCEDGAEPPFGGLYGIRTIMDKNLEDVNHIVFPAGTHDKAIHMRMEDYLSLAKPEIVISHIVRNPIGMYKNQVPFASSDRDFFYAFFNIFHFYSP
jgi:Ala-tRNA(Pro) deacylase